MSPCSAGRDDLEDPRRLVAGVPERMPLAASQSAGVMTLIDVATCVIALAGG